MNGLQKSKAKCNSLDQSYKHNAQRVETLQIHKLINQVFTQVSVKETQTVSGSKFVRGHVFFLCVQIREILHVLNATQSQGCDVV